MKLYCAVCGHHVAPDDVYVRADAVHKRINDRNDTEEFVFHDDCWRGVSGGWRDPA